ncbi:MAG: cryptochrome/photolyase family protein [Bacteroidota bacterium]
MKEAHLVFPHQLFQDSPLPKSEAVVYLVEEYLFFRQCLFHKQKIAFHRASMKKYQAYLEANGRTVRYVEAIEEECDVRWLIPKLKRAGIGLLHFVDPCDDWLEQRIRITCEQVEIITQEYESPLFLNDRNQLRSFFDPGKKKFHQTTFYQQQRRKRNILLDELGKPEGGKWTYDTENRKKYPASKTPPPVQYFDTDEFYKEAVAYVNAHFFENPGHLSNAPLYPTDFEQANAWYQQFLEFRFLEFGPYEDALVSQNSILHHSLLTPALNVGLITPQHVLRETMSFAESEGIPLNSTEGFVRQIIGWREFIRGMYISKGRQQRSRNFWGFSRKIPSQFYDGTTGISPLDNTIRKVLQTGYCHHIERLMVLGNFMLLCEFDPDEVYHWFMELFIDAYDWVMVPNVYGMSQFADGGLMATKPYISGSNYIMKMSNYKKGPWQAIWDALFWRFMDVHRAFFLQNPRLGMLVRTFDKMPEHKKKAHHAQALSFLEQLDAALEG